MAEIIVKKPEKKGVLDPHTVQKIIGVKDFVALPTTPVTPTLNQHLVRKKYVDDNLALYVLATGARAMEELRLTPKSSSSGPEGTIFYDSDDDHIYVATE